MAKVSQYQRITTLTGDEKLLGVQGTGTGVVTPKDLAAFAAVEVGAVTLTAVEQIVAPKADTTYVQQQISILAAGQGNGMVTYATVAGLPAADPGEGKRLAWVYADPTTESNGAWIWDGAAWVKSADMTTMLLQDVEQIESTQRADQALNEGRFGQLHGFVEVDAAAQVPLLLDSRGVQVAGIDTDRLRLTGITAAPESTDISQILQTENLAAFQSDGATKLPIFVDARGVALCGFDITENRFFPDAGGGGGSAAASGYIDTPIPENYRIVNESARLHIQQYGQSLSVGGSTVGYSTNAFYPQALTFGNGPKSTKDGGTGNLGGTSTRKLLVEDNNSNTGGIGAGSGETGLMAACHEIIERHYRRGDAPPPLFACTAGHGGYSLAELSWPSWWSQVLRDQIDESKARAATASETIDIPVLTWIQGESDGGTAPADYKAGCIELMGQVNTYANLGHDIPWLMYQTPRGIARTHFEMARDLPGFYHATAIYDLPDIDGTHLTAFGYHKMGRRFGRAIDQLLSGNRPRCIWPKSATRRGNTIRWEFDVPRPPLRIDTSLPATANSGFSLAVDGVVAASNSYSYTVDGTAVVFDITALGLSESAEIEVRYALDYRAPTSTWMASARTGNVCDSTTDTFFYAGVEYPMPYIMPHCYSAVTTLKTGSDTQ